MFKRYPICKHRVDVSKLEQTMRGKNDNKTELARLCRKIYDECIKNLDRTTHLINQLRASLPEEDEEED